MSADAMVMRHRPARLAWSVPSVDRRRFRRILGVVALLCVVFGLALPWIPRPPENREHPGELPQRLAKLLIEHETPPPIELPKPPEPEAKKPEKEKPPEKTKETEAAKKPIPERLPGEVAEAARKKAQSTGLLALRDDLAEIRDKPAAVQMNQDIKQGPGVGTGTGAGIGAGNGPGLPSRALITSNATGGSGGINTGRFSRDTGGGGLAGRNTTLVEGGIAGGGQGGGGRGLAGGGTGGSLARGGGGKASRALEDIRLVFEKNKGAINAIYYRALRDDPALEGKVVVWLKISPGGDVVDARIESSELKNPDLEKKLLSRIRQFDFGAKDVEVMVVTWPLDFLPS
jgi:outer membrane biosynthesis protein TonB